MTVFSGQSTPFSQVMRIGRPPRFSGWGGEALEELILRPNHDVENVDLFHQLQAIGQKEGFGVRALLEKREVTSMQDVKINYQHITEGAIYGPWAQDAFAFFPTAEGTKIGIFSKYHKDTHLPELLSKAFNLPLKHIKRMYQIGEGAHLMMVTPEQGKTRYLVHESRYGFPKRLADELECEASQIAPIPSVRGMFTHLDMAITPLSSTVALVKNEALDVQFLKEAIDKSPDKKERERLETVLKAMETQMKTMTDEDWAQEAENMALAKQQLHQAGFKQVIDVPGQFEGGRFMIPDPDRYEPVRGALHYLNAITHKNSKGELVYITNDSGFPTLNQLFQSYLEKNVPGINVYFVSGTRYPDQSTYLAKSLGLGGGVHCRVVERPKRLQLLA